MFAWNLNQANKTSLETKTLSYSEQQKEHIQEKA